MKKAALLILVLLAGTALALDYQTALSLAWQRPTVISAQLKLDNLEAQLERTNADPLALRLDRLRAKQNRDLAAAELQLARIRACSQISSAYTHVLDAEEQVLLAQKALALAEKVLKISRLRFDKGGASKQDVIAAEIKLREAQDQLKAAQNGAQLARSQLVSLLGVEAGSDKLEPTPTLATPAWREVSAALQKHPDWLKPHQVAELAAVAYELLDPSYAAPAQIEEARVGMERAQKGAGEAERGLRLLIKQRWNEVSRQKRTAALAAEKLEKALSDLDITRQRYRAGLISELALRHAELQTDQVRLELSAAQHAQLAALWSLFEAAGWLPSEVCHAR